MPWLRFRVCTHKDHSERYANALEDYGALAVTLEDAGSQPLFASANEETSLWNQTWVIGLFPADTQASAVQTWLQDQLQLPQAPVYDCETLADQDWERAWMDRFVPIHCGGRLWVCPSWHTPPDTNGVNVILDPGLAFGTGTHATTHLCLNWLATQPLLGKTLIDYGCGSGILAIAALKLGASSAWGVDVDEHALVVSGENARINQVDSQLTLSLPQQLPSTQKADWVVANILAPVLIDLAPDLTALVKPQGRLLMSGILHEQVEEVASHYGQHFHLQERIQDGWAMLVGTPR